MILTNHLKFFHAKKLNIVLFGLLFIAALGFNSCRNLTCPQCGGEQELKESNDYNLYHFELHEETDVTIGGQIYQLRSFNAYFPEFTGSEDHCMLTAIIIRDKNDEHTFGQIVEARAKGDEKTVEELLPSIRLHLKLDPDYASVIKRVSFYADPDEPSIDTSFTCDYGCITCWRDRECLWESTGFVDKIELRLMAGWRYDALDGVFYNGPRGGTYYEKETFGFDRGGTDITIGLEAAALWELPFLSSGRDAFSIGLMTGLWPVDGSWFVPLAIHPRYTFNDVTDPLECSCDAWYLFGDLGFAWDPSGDVPMTCGEECGDDLKSYFWDLGIGYDFWVSECMDFSVDLGFRHTQLPLPANEECEDCTGIGDKYPVRIANQIFLRFGVTW